MRLTSFNKHKLHTHTHTGVSVCTHAYVHMCVIGKQGYQCVIKIKQHEKMKVELV